MEGVLKITQFNCYSANEETNCQRNNDLSKGRSAIEVGSDATSPAVRPSAGPFQRGPESALSSFPLDSFETNLIQIWIYFPRAAWIQRRARSRPALTGAKPDPSSWGGRSCWVQCLGSSSQLSSHCIILHELASKVVNISCQVVSITLKVPRIVVRFINTKRLHWRDRAVWGRP